MQPARSSFASSLLSGSVALLLLATSATAQLTWSQVSAGTPPARSAAAACRSFNTGVLVFGGLQGSAPLGDTWRFVDQTWTQLSPALAPSPRSHHAMAALDYGEVGLFGGRDGNGAALGDLWLWDSTAQSWIPGPTGPAAREGAAMAAGPLLFGGRDGAQTFSDLWSLSPATTWQNVTPAAGSPSPRHGHALVCAEQFQRYWLLFGGVDGAGNHLADTWRLDQSGATYTWTQLSPATSPSARSGHAMRWSLHRERVQLFGGEGPAGLLGDTWEWDGAGWVPIATVGAPAARADAVLVETSYTPVTSPWRGLFVGGRDASGPLAEAWLVESTVPATRVPYYFPMPSLVFLTGNGAPWVGGSFTVGITSVSPLTVLQHLIVGFTAAPPTPLGSAFNNHWLLVNPAVLVPLSGSGSSTQTTIVVPAAPSLFGAHLYMQGIALLPPSMPFPGWNLTTRLDCQLGWL